MDEWLMSLCPFCVHTATFQQQSHSINTAQCDPNNILKVWSIKWPARVNKTVHVFVSAVPWCTGPSARCVYEEALDADSLCWWALGRNSLWRDIILALVWNVCVLCFVFFWVFLFNIFHLAAAEEEEKEACECTLCNYVRHDSVTGFYGWILA